MTEAQTTPETTEEIQGDLRLLEAILFASPEPVPIKALAERFPEDRVQDIPDLLKMLQLRYADHGVQLVERDGAWAFRTAEDLSPKLEVEREVPKKLSRAALETLAIIAYHQPVTRAEIESIRGVATGRGTLDLLMEADWVRPGRRRRVPGKPLTWVTTDDFLDHFGLESLDELPGLEELKAAGLLDARPAIEAMPKTPDMFGEDEEEETDDDDGVDESGDYDEDEIAALAEDEDGEAEDEDGEAEETVDEFDEDDTVAEDEDFDDEDYDDEGFDDEDFEDDIVDENETEDDAFDVEEDEDDDERAAMEENR